MNDNDFGNYGGAQVGTIVGARWEYPSIGYNATHGVFYVDEVKQGELAFTPFALRQCKEVTDALGVVHRYPIKTPRKNMIDGDTEQRLQVVGLVDGNLYVFGARSWTARAAWVNPRGGPYHSEQFPIGIWYQLEDYIAKVKAERGLVTAPLCYEVALMTGKPVDIASAANAKQKSTGTPILATSFRFVGGDQAKANEALFIAEDIDAWVAEWGKAEVQSPVVDERETFTAAVAEPDEIAF